MDFVWIIAVVISRRTVAIASRNRCSAMIRAREAKKMTPAVAILVTITFTLVEWKRMCRDALVANGDKAKLSGSTCAALIFRHIMPEMSRVLVISSNEVSEEKDAGTSSAHRKKDAPHLGVKKTANYQIVNEVVNLCRMVRVAVTCSDWATVPTPNLRLPVHHT